MEASLIADHERYRTVVYPLMKSDYDASNMDQATMRELCLFQSINYFAETYPTKELREEAIRRKEQTLLSKDHAQLQAILEPRLRYLQVLPEALRWKNQDYRLVTSPEYFAALYPTHKERQLLIRERQQENIRKDYW